MPYEGAEAKGRLAQLAEHLAYTERVGGSNPSPPTSPGRDGGSPARQQPEPDAGPMLHRGNSPPPGAFIPPCERPG